MKVAQLLHNPKAGDQEHSKEKLIERIEAEGYTCHYSSTKKDGWEETHPDADFLIVAGGDGTVRKVARMMLQKKLLDSHYPIALLPLGTANNISNTLLPTLNVKDLIKGWKGGETKRIDIAKVTGLPDATFFMEGLGFGVFPNLMREMKEVDEAELDTPEKSIAKAHEVLLSIIEKYEARTCKLEIDGVDHSGKFLLVEIMNIRSVGPNLNINPLGDPGDGELEIVIIPENQREKFISYLKDKMSGKEEPFCFSAIKGQQIKVSWDGSHAHLDDELIKTKKPIEATVDIRPGLLNFRLPAVEDATKTV